MFEESRSSFPRNDLSLVKGFPERGNWSRMSPWQKRKHLLNNFAAKTVTTIHFYEWIVILWMNIMMVMMNQQCKERLCLQKPEAKFISFRIQNIKFISISIKNTKFISFSIQNISSPNIPFLLSPNSNYSKQKVVSHYCSQFVCYSLTYVWDWF